MSIYRRIYEENFGSIPRELDGRSYDIHHLDGNHANNHPQNLKALTVKDHFDIHYAQGDWGACNLLARNLDITPAQRSEISAKTQLERVQKGIHHFLGGQIQKDLVKKGNHHWQNIEKQQLEQKRRIKQGTHNFLTNNPSKYITKERMLKGTHTSQMSHCCTHCSKVGMGPVMFRHHFSNCKSKH